jgi:hypothetical protein
LDKKIKELDGSLKRFRSLLAFKASHGLLDDEGDDEIQDHGEKIGQEDSREHDR